MTIGKITTIWSSGKQTQKTALFDKDTGSIIFKSPKSKSFAVRSFFTDKDGIDYDICQKCKCHIIKHQIIDDVCSIPYCSGDCDD